MLFDKFINQTKIFWTSYLTEIVRAQKEGRTNSHGGKITYPNILLFTQTQDHFIAEFFGFVDSFTSFSIKKHKEESIHRYFGQFDDTTRGNIILENECISISGICLSNLTLSSEINKRFPLIKYYRSTVTGNKKLGSPLAFGKNSTTCHISDCLLVNEKDGMYRCKHVNNAIVVTKSVTTAKLNKLFHHMLNHQQAKIINTIYEGEHALNLASQLQSLYLFPKLRETTLGEFLKLHPEIINLAFNTQHFLYEPSLIWLEHDGTCTDTAINPDLMIKRADGHYDICDLKTAALENKSITKSSRSRRRFIDYVCEGIAQLANYREYFDYPENAEYAKSKYGVTINNPRLILIIGSWDNVDANEVIQACRQHKEHIEVIDYDTLCQLYLAANQNLSVELPA